MSRRKLLLADDSITIQKVVNLTFADEGVDVVTVGDGNAALEELASGLPDILLADVNMPGPTGYEICEQLRSSEATRNLPVILLVGSFEPFDEAEASRVGANAYLTKPFQSIRQLVSQVNELINAANPPAEIEPESETFPEPAAETSRVSEELETPEYSSAAVTAEPASETVPSEAAAEPEPDGSAESAPRYFDDLGYETGVPPAEPDSPTAPVDEIESLYAQSISAGDNGLSDVGIDDEMIETSYSADAVKNDLADFQAEVDASSDSYSSEPTYSEPPAETPAAAAEAADPASFSSGYEQRFPDDPSKFENTIAFEDWKPADMRAEAQAEDQVLAPAGEPQSFETTKLDGAYPQEIEQPEPAVGDDTIRMEGRFDTTGAAFQFDDVNLLDLSNSSEAPVEITSPANAVEQGSSKQIVTLSPELIEMIAQRVVEKLSEKY